MEVTCSREALVSAVKPVARAIPSKPSIPSDSWFLVQATDDDFLHITGGPHDCQITARAEAVCTTPGTVAVDSKSFIELVSNLNAADIHISFLEQVAPKDAIIDSHLGLLAIETDHAYSVINTLNHHDFVTRPQPPDPTDDNSIVLDGARLDEALHRVLVTTVYRQDRPNLFGVNMVRLDDHLYFASTDSVRLTVNRVPMLNNGPGEWDYTLPAHAARQLKNIIRAEPATFIIDDNGATIAITCGDFRITSALLALPFTDWQALATEQYRWSFQIEPRDLMELVASGVAFSHHDMAAIRFNPPSIADGDDPSRIYTQCSHREIGTLDTSAPISNQFGEPITVDVNYSFMRDISRMKLNKTIAVSVPDFTSPINISMPDNPDFYHILAPMAPRLG